jgi:hypothetical protein
VAGGFIGLKALPVRSPAKLPQAGRNTAQEQDAERREEEILSELGEEDGPGRSQQNQSGGFTPYSD